MGHIHALQVDKGNHRSGLGSALMCALEKHSKEIGINRLKLNVDNDNTKALSLYTKLGYLLLEAEVEGKPQVLTYTKTLS